MKYLNLTGKPVKLKRSGVYLPPDGLLMTALKIRPECNDEICCVFNNFVFYVKKERKWLRMESGEISRFLKRMGEEQKSKQKCSSADEIVVIVKGWKEKAVLNRVVSSDILVAIPYPGYELEEHIVAEFLIF